jgi:hypothetical protein
MQTASVVASPVESYVFRKSVWEYVDTPEGRTVKGFAGTWTPPYEGSPPWLLALISCPACGTNLLLHNRVVSIDRLGKIHPDIRCNKCTFTRTCYLDKWNDKDLYACAIEVDGQPQIHYMHAQNQAEARLHLGPVAHKKSFRIVALGRAIGFVANDDHAEDLSADVMFRKKETLQP